MKKNGLLIILIGCTCILSFSATYYIDPQYRGSAKGTMQNPYNSWEQIQWKAGNTYLFKRGSTYKTGLVLRPTADHIIISAYGEGKNPKIISTLGSSGRVFDLGALKNIQLKNLEIISENGAETCIHFFKSTGGSLINCSVSGSQWGIRNVLSSSTFYIKNCIISKISDDGIFISDMDSVIIENTHIYDVNLNYYINKHETFSGGDCVQLVNVKYFQIMNNIFDHSSTGNKFCFISSSKSDQIIPTGIIEGNKFIRSSVPDEGDLLYLTGSNDVLIANNNFFYGDHAIYNHSTNLKVLKNVFIKQHLMAVYDEPKNIAYNSFINNTFSQISKGIESHAKAVIILNNIFFQINSASLSGNARFESKNNCFFPKKIIGFNTVDSGSFVADPLFMNYNSNNFKLKSGSPCAGKSVALRSTLKKAILDSIPRNIGAY